VQATASPIKQAIHNSESHAFLPPASTIHSLVQCNACDEFNSSGENNRSFFSPLMPHHRRLPLSITRVRPQSRRNGEMSTATRVMLVQLERLKLIPIEINDSQNLGPWATFGLKIT